MCLKDSSKDVPGLSLNIEVMGTSDELNQQSQQKPGEEREMKLYQQKGYQLGLKQAEKVGWSEGRP